MLVIIPKQVKQTMKRKYPQLRLIGMAGVSRLSSRGARGDHDISEKRAARAGVRDPSLDGLGTP